VVKELPHESGHAGSPDMKPSKGSQGKSKGAGKVVIPIVAVIVVLAVFAGLWFFTDILPFGNNDDDAQQPPVVTDNGGNGTGGGAVQPTTPPPSPTASPTPPTTPDPSPPTALVPDSVIDGSGGEFHVKGATLFEFIPTNSGRWEFRTSDNGNSDPFLELFTIDGSIHEHDDDSGGNYNALLVVNLEAGETYFVLARFFGTGTGSYTLTVSEGE